MPFSTKVFKRSALVFVSFSGAYSQVFLFIGQRPIASLRDRIKRLNKGKEESVEDVLSKLSSLLVRKNPPFDKDEAFDVLIELKAVARSSNHAKLPYLQAVFQALKDKTSASPDQFRKYLAALLGDKHQERVLVVLSKVDNSVRRSAPPLPRPSQTPVPNRGYRGSFSFVQCFYCGSLGHLQSRFFRRLSDLQFNAGPSKRFNSGRPGPNSQLPV